jgi:hypothetical protein
MKGTSDKKNHERAIGQTAISFSLSTKLRKRIEAAAKKDNRPISNWLQVIVDEALKAKDEKK